MRRSPPHPVERDRSHTHARVFTSMPEAHSKRI